MESSQNEAGPTSPLTPPEERRDAGRPERIGRRVFVGRTLAATAAIAGGIAGTAAGREADGARETAGGEKGPPRRRTAVDLVPLGKTGLELTRLGMGTGSNGGKVQRDLGQKGFTRLVRHAYDRGIRYIDTADMYRIHGMIKEAIKGLPREELFIQSKIRWELEPDVGATLDRFRKELGIEYIDSVLIHCARNSGWPGSLAKMRDALSKAKEKKIIRAHGVSCHGLPALREVAGCSWVDVDLARINPMGHKVDGDTSDWNARGKVKEACAQIARIHAAGKGVIGMKIIGNGDFRKPEERERSIRFAMSRPYIDAVVIGFKSPAEIDEAIRRMNAALAV